MQCTATIANGAVREPRVGMGPSKGEKRTNALRESLLAAELARRVPDRASHCPLGRTPPPRPTASDASWPPIARRSCRLAAEEVDLQQANATRPQGLSEVQYLFYQHDMYSQALVDQLQLERREGKIPIKRARCFPVPWEEHGAQCLVRSKPLYLFDLRPSLSAVVIGGVIRPLQ